MHGMESFFLRIRKESTINYLYFTFSLLIFLTVLFFSFKLWTPLKDFPDFGLVDLLQDIGEIGFFESISFSLKFLKGLLWLSFLFSIVHFFISKKKARSIYRHSFMISSLLGLIAVQMMRPLYQILPNLFVKDGKRGLFSTALFKASYLKQEDFLTVILAYHMLVIAAAFAFIAFVFTALKILRKRTDEIQWVSLRKGKE